MSKNKKLKLVSRLAQKFILDSLARHEDMALSAIAEKRIDEFEKKSPKTISHEDAWK